MSLCVLHVLESSNPDAGSVVVCLSGLLDALPSRGLQYKTVAPHADATRALDDADMVHIHGWGYELAHRIAAHSLKAGKPYVVSPHGALTYGPYHKLTWKERLRFIWQTRRLVRGAACVTALNPVEERDLHTQRIHPRLRVLPYGLCFTEYEGRPPTDQASPSADRRLLMMGPLHPRAGCVAFLKAMAEIGPDANGWNVVLAGSDDGEWRKMLEAAIRRKKSDDRVVVAHAGTVSEQRACLARASLLAAPGLHVSLPVSIMQAVATGVAVIASTYVAPPGLDRAIRVCGPRREELRETLRSVLRLPEETLRAMGEKARTVGRALFDWAVLADEYAQLYREIMEI